MEPSVSCKGKLSKKEKKAPALSKSSKRHHIDIARTDIFLIILLIYTKH